MRIYLIGSDPGVATLAAQWFKKIHGDEVTCPWWALYDRRKEIGDAGISTRRLRGIAAADAVIALPPYGRDGDIELGVALATREVVVGIGLPPEGTEGVHFSNPALLRAADMLIARDVALRRLRELGVVGRRASDFGRSLDPVALPDPLSTDPFGGET